MTEEIVLLQHRFSDQLRKVKLSRYRTESRGRYRDWRLCGQSRFIAPPDLKSIGAIKPAPSLQMGFFLSRGGTL